MNDTETETGRPEADPEALLAECRALAHMSGNRAFLQLDGYLSGGGALPVAWEDAGDPGEYTGAYYTDGASAERENCGCGEPITWYAGTWMHIINPELRGTDDHHAEPGSGFYVPGDEDDDEGAQP